MPWGLGGAPLTGPSKAPGEGVKGVGVVEAMCTPTAVIPGGSPILLGGPLVVEGN